MIKGLDLSPYFLAVAAQKEEQLSRQNPIRWVHANGEATGLPSDSFDVVSLAYVVISIRPNYWTVHICL
jgi:ubiquinone/menaquinone biosynthesis C-methylase UbiE